MNILGTNIKIHEGNLSKYRVIKMRNGSALILFPSNEKFVGQPTPIVGEVTIKQF